MYFVVPQPWGVPHRISKTKAAGMPLSAVANSFLAPNSSNKRTTSSCPWKAAICRGVLPWTSAVAISFSAPYSSKSLATWLCPRLAAKCKAVLPLSMVTQSLWAPTSKSSRTTSTRPVIAAPCNGVTPTSLVVISFLRATARCKMAANHVTLGAKKKWDRQPLLTSTQFCH